MGSKATTSRLWGPNGESLLPVYVGRRGAPKGNRHAERHGGYNREANAAHASVRALLKESRAMIAEANLFLAERRAARVLMQTQPMSCPDPSPSST